MTAVSLVRVGDKNLYVVGGQRLGGDFLASLALPTGMRALLYQSLSPNLEPSNLIDETGPVLQAERFAPFLAMVKQQPGEQRFQIAWTKNAATVEEFHTLSLAGRNKELAGVLLVGSSRAEVVTLERRIRLLALGVGALGIFLGVLLSWWGAAGVTRPVLRLVEGTREISTGKWDTRVAVRGGSEIAELARAFNQMTQHLTEERQRMIQLERVASWREIARRLAQELGEAMSRLQSTIEELQPAGGLHDSAETLLSETQAMKEIVGRYGDFSRMPRPAFAAVNLNDIVKSVVKLFAPRFSAVGRPPVNPEVHLDEDLPVIQADASLLHRALENLVLNAMDAMPAGGVLMIRTSQQHGDVELEVSDTGSGLSAEESERLFTPYYATKQHGTGLGLAIVQSVVSDHGGRITVESETGVGTSFHITLPAKPPARITGKGSSALRPAEHPLQNEMRGQIDHDDHK